MYTQERELYIIDNVFKGYFLRVETLNVQKSQEEKYSVGNVCNIVITLCGDGW